MKFIEINRLLWLLERRLPECEITLASVRHDKKKSLVLNIEGRHRYIVIDEMFKFTKADEQKTPLTLCNEIMGILKAECGL